MFSSALCSASNGTPVDMKNRVYIIVNGVVVRVEHKRDHCLMPYITRESGAEFISYRRSHQSTDRTYEL